MGKIDIVDISTAPDNTNQYVLNAGEAPPEENVFAMPITLFNKYRRENNRPAAAFKLIPDNNISNRFNVPLQITAGFGFDVESGGTYYMTAEVNDFKLVSHPFYLTGNGSSNLIYTENIGPFYADVTTDCPFKVDIMYWKLYSHESDSEIIYDDHDFTIYFFLGSTALPLNGSDTPDIHYGELIRRTIPYYEDVRGKMWSEVEHQEVQQVVNRLWLFGHRDFCYDANGSGASSFLNGGTFLLGDMLQKTTSNGNNTASSCNCFDLAALVYVAFKSFGRRRATPNSPETDIFDITMHKVEDWGYIPLSTLFGWQDTGMSPANQPFWAGQQTSRVESNDQMRSFFSRHCFTLWRNSRSEEKVIDICLATPYQEYQGDEAESHVLQVGWCDLQNYLALRDSGQQQMVGRDLQDVNVTLFWVSIS